MTYIEKLVNLKKEAKWLDYRRLRRAVLIMNDVGWGRYYKRIRHLPDEALENYSAAQGCEDFHGCVSSYWRAREVWHIVMPYDQQDWRWLRMQIMRERYTTLGELSAIYQQSRRAVSEALAYCGCEPAFVGGGLTSFKVHYWDRGCTARIDLWQYLDRYRFPDVERRLAKGYVC